MICLFQIGCALSRPTFHLFHSADKPATAAFAPQLPAIVTAPDTPAITSPLPTPGAYDPGQGVLVHEALQPGEVLLVQLKNSIEETQR